MLDNNVSRLFVGDGLDQDAAKSMKDNAKSVMKLCLNAVMFDEDVKSKAFTKLTQVDKKLKQIPPSKLMGRSTIVWRILHGDLPLKSNRFVRKSCLNLSFHGAFLM